nr:myosin heavy chain-related protein [Tanacetum cinerariifolium]
MTKSQDQRSHSMKEQAYNIIKTKDSITQRQSNLKKFKEARFKISPQKFKDHSLGDIVSFKIYAITSLQSGVASLDAKGSLDANEEIKKAHTRIHELEKQMEKLPMEL